MTEYLPETSASAAAIVLASRIFLPGMAWLWLCSPSDGSRPGPVWRSGLIASALCVVIGLLYTLLTALLLSELGMYRPLVDTVTTGLFTVTGVCLGIRQKRSRVFHDMAGPATAWLGTALLFAFVLKFAPHGEWIAGGWDPGIYVNEGIATARTGTIHPPPVNVYEKLTAEELRIFSRNVRRNPAVCSPFRAIPIRTDTRDMVYYFYRLTPSAVAFAARHGGITAAVRVNALLGVLVVLVFAAALARNKVTLPHLLYAVVFLATSPTWLHHLHFPTSEMLHLLLVAALLLLLPGRQRGADLALAAVTVLALVLNRISVLPFAGVFILALAVMDIVRADRRRTSFEMVCLLLAVFIGAVYDFTACDVTTRHLHRSVPLLLTVCCVAIGGALVVTRLGSSSRLRERLLRLPTWTVPTGMGLLTVGYILAAWLGREQGVGSLGNALHLAPFLGVTVTLVALAEFPFFSCSRCSRELRLGAAFMATVTALLLVNKSIASIYPWATRRYLPYAVPAIAILAGHAASRLHGLRKPFQPWGHAAGILLVLTLVGCNAKRSWHAWQRTDFVGMIGIMSDIAEQIDDDEIIVADHDDWGTPLMLVFGKQVLNGRYFYADEGDARMEQGLEALRRLAAAGTRIRFLTSTGEGLGCYPLTIPKARQEWNSGPFRYEVGAHHRNARDYDVVGKEREFRLYSAFR